VKIEASVTLTLYDKEVKEAVQNAAKLAMRDTVVAIGNDAIRDSPKKTGNNMRSIKYETGPGGEIATKALEGAVYSTSGYGGYLEVGTSRMPARSYFRPALDRNFTQEKFGQKIKEHLK